jgi:hypothetical protein
MAVRGEMPDLLPYVPRIDLWYNANSLTGSLPERHRGRSQDEISRAEGWALHKTLPDLLDTRGPEGLLHRGLGLFSVRQMGYRFQFSPTIDIEVEQEGDTTCVRYHTPIGVASVETVFTDELRRAGSTIPFIKEHVIKRPEDYRVVGYLFENIELFSDDDGFLQWQDEAGENGYCASAASLASSPMHHIQKDFLDATTFFYHYHDYPKEMEALSKSVEHFYDQVLTLASRSPAEAIFWGGNFDETITYPPYFKKEILPWIRKAVDVLHASGKRVICHCDGENLGLMDLIRDSGIDVAEAICPYPMTKVSIEKYYERWANQLTIFGGVPSNLLLAETTSDGEFEAYLDHLFKVVAPGRRMILGIADTTPPHAVFDRLVRIGERVAREGRLPLKRRK